jgi:hypothetical protein
MLCYHRAVWNNAYRIEWISAQRGGGAAAVGSKRHGDGTVGDAYPLRARDGSAVRVPNGRVTNTAPMLSVPE